MRKIVFTQKPTQQPTNPKGEFRSYDPVDDYFRKVAKQEQRIVNDRGAVKDSKKNVSDNKKVGCKNSVERDCQEGNQKTIITNSMPIHDGKPNHNTNQTIEAPKTTPVIQLPPIEPSDTPKHQLSNQLPPPSELVGQAPIERQTNTQSQSNRRTGMSQPKVRGNGINNSRTNNTKQQKAIDLIKSTNKGTHKTVQNNNLYNTINTNNIINGLPQKTDSQKDTHLTSDVVKEQTHHKEQLNKISSAHQIKRLPMVDKGVNTQTSTIGANQINAVSVKANQSQSNTRNPSNKMPSVNKSSKNLPTPTILLPPMPNSPSLNYMLKRQHLLFGQLAIQRQLNQQMVLRVKGGELNGRRSYQKEWEEYETRNNELDDSLEVGRDNDWQDDYQDKPTRQLRLMAGKIKALQMTLSKVYSGLISYVEAKAQGCALGQEMKRLVGLIDMVGEINQEDSSNHQQVKKGFIFPMDSVEELTKLSAKELSQQISQMYQSQNVNTAQRHQKTQKRDRSQINPPKGNQNAGTVALRPPKLSKIQLNWSVVDDNARTVRTIKQLLRLVVAETPTKSIQKNTKSINSNQSNDKDNRQGSQTELVVGYQSSQKQLIRSLNPLIVQSLLLHALSHLALLPTILSSPYKELEALIDSFKGSIQEEQAKKAKNIMIRFRDVIGVIGG